MNIIEIRNLNFSYDGRKKILDNISFDIAKGELVGIIGESGCGKSTLCHILCGMIPDAIGGDISGSAVVGGRNLREARLKDMVDKTGFVMQDPDRQIVTSMVEDELAFGPENICMQPQEIRRRVDEILKLLDIDDIRYENPNRLSGGQKQLVAIGSVLTLDPDILILDEPYSHLDEENRRETMQLVDRLHLAGRTIIIVEHDHGLIGNADRWILLEDGRIKAQGPPDELGDMI